MFLLPTLLKSQVPGHFKTYSSHSFQPTGIVGSLYWNISANLLIDHFFQFFFQFLKLFILPKKYKHFKKFHTIYYSFFLKQR